MKLFKKLLLLAATMLFVFAAKATTNVHAYYDGVCHDANGKTMDCYRVLVVITVTMDDGTEQVLSSGTVHVGNCDGAVDDVANNNKNCPPYIYDGQTFYTDASSANCLGTIATQPDIYPGYEQARDKALENAPKGKSQNSLQTSVIKNNGNYFTAYANPVRFGQNLHLQFNAENFSQIKNSIIIVYDIDGKQIANIDVSGRHLTEINLPAAGIYHVCLKQGNTLLQKQTIICTK